MKLIDKVVAELERRLEAIRMAFDEPGILSGVDRTYANAQYDAFKSLLSFIDTIEAKEVDLEKEIDTIVDAVSCRREHIEFIAKHFYGLGLQAHNEEMKPSVEIDKETLCQLCDAILNHYGYSDINDYPDNDSECFYGKWDKEFREKVKDIHNKILKESKI